MEKPKYAVLNWHRASGTYWATGYYCSNCAGFIGKDASGITRCRYCEAKIVGKYL